MSELNAIRVLIADDEPGMRMILRKMIARVDGYELVGEAADGAELMELCQRSTGWPALTRFRMLIRTAC